MLREYRYRISADGGKIWAEQWLTEDEAVQIAGCGYTCERVYGSREPFAVTITETYEKTVVVFAKSAESAQEIALTLCDAGIIDLERDCYAGRDAEASLPEGRDLENYEIYDEKDVGDEEHEDG